MSNLVRAAGARRTGVLRPLSCTGLMAAEVRRGYAALSWSMTIETLRLTYLIPLGIIRTMIDKELVAATSASITLSILSER